MKSIEAAKDVMYAISSIEIGGYQIDTGLHLVGGFCLVWLMSRLISLKKSANAALGLILFKELFDLFARPHTYRPRSLHMDLFYDVISGVLGVALAYWLLGRWGKRASQSSASP